MRIYTRRTRVLPIPGSLAKRELFLLLFAAVAVAVACNKGNITPPAQTSPGYYGRQAFILPINANFILYDSAAKLTGLIDTLSQAGPYTNFIPDNNALGWGGLSASGQINYFQPPSNAKTILLSLLFAGLHYLDSLPAGTNQVWTSLAGNHAYISKYISPDTVYTINGVQVYTPDFPSTNGPIEVLDSRIPYLESYQNILAYVNSEPELSYLAVALQRSGLSQLLSDTTKSWTLLAPTNSAFQNSNDPSFTTLDSLLVVDTAKLASLMRFSVLPGRSFLFDFGLLGNGSDTVKLSTLYAGEQLSLLLSPGYSAGTSFYGYGDSSQQYNYGTGMYYNVPAPVGLYNPNYSVPVADIPTRNGNVHELSGMLIP